MQTLPAVSSQVDKQQLRGSGQSQLEPYVLQELSPSAADSRSSNPNRHPAAHRQPTPATPPDLTVLLPRETTQTHIVSRCAKLVDNADWDSQQHLGTHSYSTDCTSHHTPLTVPKSRAWWPQFGAHAAHPLPKDCVWHLGEHGHVQNHDNWSSAAKPAAPAAQLLVWADNGQPDWLRGTSVDQQKSSSTSSLAPSQAELNHSQAGVLVRSPVSPVSHSKNQHLLQQADASLGQNASGKTANRSWSPDSPQAASSSANTTHDVEEAKTWADPDFPEEYLQILASLASIFGSLPPKVVENVLRSAAFNEDTAAQKCLDLMNRAGESWSDSGSPSDGDSGSVAAESQFEASSPMHPQGISFSDPSQRLEELTFEEKVEKLHSDFPDMDVAQLQVYLNVAEGSYDTAFAHLFNDIEEHQQQQERLEQQALEDRKFAMQLASEDTTQPEKPEATELDPNKLAQDFETDLVLSGLEAKHPNVRASLKILTDRFWTIDKALLANLLGVADGKVEDVIQMVEPESKGLTAKAAQLSTSVAGSSSAASSKAVGTAAVGRALQGPSPVYEAGRCISPPPGFNTLRTQAPKPIQAPRHTAKHTAKPDIYHDARSNFKEAQENIVACNRDFHAARRCHDTQAQKRLSGQLAYWQNVAKEEKLRASKKIFTSKNAQVTNTYKLDLHALHVDEAIDKIQETRRDLRKFPCTWQIEAVTGKGLHSVGNEPKLLPAVKAFLDSEGIPWWPGNPGMVVFQLNPEPEEF